VRGVNAKAKIPECLTLSELQLQRYEDVLYEPLSHAHFVLPRKCSEGRVCTLRALELESSREYCVSPYLLYDTEIMALRAEAIDGGRRGATVGGIRRAGDTLQEAFGKHAAAYAQMVNSPQPPDAYKKSDLRTLLELKTLAVEVRKAYIAVCEECNLLLGTAGAVDALLRQPELGLQAQAHSIVCPCASPRRQVTLSLHGKYASLYRHLMDTAELARSHGVQQAGFLSRKYPTATHTRRSHAAGSWIVMWHALAQIRVGRPSGQMPISLGDWLDSYGCLAEFVCSVMLHDVGHPPFSHTLEANPELPLDHEMLSHELVIGPTRVVDEKCRAEDSREVTQHTAADLVDLACTINAMQSYRDAHALELEALLSKVKASPEMPSCMRDLRTTNVHQVLRNFGVNVGLVGEMMRAGQPSDHTKSRRRTSPEGLLAKDLKPVILSLLNERLDLDRIDHIYRDAYFSQAKSFDVKTGDLFTNMMVRLPAKAPRPVLMVNDVGKAHAMRLLTARSHLNDHILWERSNMFLVGALNMLVARIVRVSPFHAQVIPFLTDSRLLSTCMRTPFKTSDIRALLATVQDDSAFRLYAEALVVPRLEVAADKEGPSVAESLCAIFAGLPTPELTPPKWWRDARNIAGDLPPFVYYYRPPRTSTAADGAPPAPTLPDGEWTAVDSLDDPKTLYGRGTLMLWRHARLELDDPMKGTPEWTEASIKDFVARFGRGGGSAA
jgi:HD superfamily phosphohydrolase